MIKRIISAGITIAAAAFWGISAYAEAIPVEFYKHGGGQFLYCNNPEFLNDEDLSTDENKSSTYMMKNKGLEPDNYSVFFCCYNWTGTDIEPDIEFVSDDAVITINSVGYYLPQEYDFWDCIGAWSDYLGVNIRTLNNYQQYVPYQGIDLPKTFTLKNGGREWISKFIYNYIPVPPKVTFNMLVDFTIEEGTADVNFAALKNYDVVGDRSHHDVNAASGVYHNDTSIKGIETESLPMVESDLNVEITADDADGKRLGVRIFNQYFPDGNDSDFWMTNINPSRDQYLYSKGVAVGSDMLTFEFNDEEKEKYYGENITDRDNTWVFDIYHYNTLGYENGMPWKREDHIPNAEMDEVLDINNLPNLKWQFNLGNFGVTNRYNMTITNSDSRERYLNYLLETSLSSNIVIVRDEDGNMLNPYTLTYDEPFALCKGINSQKTEACMFSVKLNAGETKKYIIDVILPTNCYGGIVNYLVPDSRTYLNTPEFTEFPEFSEYHDYKNTFFDGERQMKWENGTLYRHDGTKWQKIVFPDSAKAVFASRSGDMRIVKTPCGYAARFAAWDEYGGNIADTSSQNKVYIFDDKFELEDTVTFNGYVSEMVYADGKVYVKAGGRRYISEDGMTFSENNTTTDMPRTNGAYTILKNNGDFYMNGLKTYSKLCFEGRKPNEIYSCGGIFYRVLSRKNYDNDTDTGNVLAVSADGVNWSEVWLPNRLLKLKNMEYIDNKLYIYCKYETFVFENVFPKDSIKVNLNNEYLSFDISAQILNDRTMVPVRFLFEKLAAEVKWIGETQEVLIWNGDVDIRLQINNPVALVNGETVEIDAPPMLYRDKTMIPIRFIAENLGYNVDWIQERQTAVITR